MFITMYYVSFYVNRVFQVPGIKEIIASPNSTQSVILYEDDTRTYYDNAYEQWETYL